MGNQIIHPKTTVPFTFYCPKLYANVKVRISYAEAMGKRYMEKLHSCDSIIKCGIGYKAGNAEVTPFAKCPYHNQSQ